MKIVINTRHGGFGLSAKAIHRLACRKHKPCYFFTFRCKDGRFCYIPFNDGYPTSTYPVATRWAAFTVTDPDNPEHRREEISLNEHLLERSDPDLVAVVEEMGKEANGEMAELKVVDIPSGVDYIIQEECGAEWIAERHRIWS